MNQSEQIKKKSMYSHILHRVCSKRFFVPLLVVFLLLFASCNRPHNLKIYRDYSRYSYVDSVPVNDSTIENLAILGKVWGFVKYYHPVFEDSVFNIDYELFELLPKIIPADYTTRNKVLCDWIDSLGTFEADEGYYKKILADTTVRKMVSYDWMNDSDKISSELSGRLNRLVYAKREGKNRYASIPVVKRKMLYWDLFSKENPYKQLSSPDCGYRLLALLRYWNMVEYYFPSKHLIGRDWNEVLQDYLPLFIASHLSNQYRSTCYQLFAEICDTHANNCLPPNLFGNRILPLCLQYVENKVIVIKSFIPEVHSGDELLAIDGIRVDTIAVNIRKYTSNSNESSFYRECMKLMRLTGKDSIELLLKKESAAPLSYMVPSSGLSHPAYSAQFSFPYDYPAYQLLNDSTGYICTNKYQEDMDEQLLKMMRKVNRLIIDIRYGAEKAFGMFDRKYLGQNNVVYQKGYAAIDTLPGFMRRGVAAHPEVYRHWKYQEKIIILVNEHTQSFSEQVALYLRTNPSAKVIGNTTAGAAGMILHINLPGGIKTIFTGAELYTPEGVLVQRLGVPLDEVVPITIQGIKEERDEVYERALELVKAL